VKRNLRRSIDLGLTGLGIGIIFTAIFLSASLDVQSQLPLVLLGVLLMEAGVWGLSSKLFPNERRYSQLRDEGDKMIQLIRELNAAAIAKDTGAEDAKRFQATLERMNESVLEMSRLASKKDDT
jgi:hypothetical protein